MYSDMTYVTSFFNAKTVKGLERVKGKKKERKHEVTNLDMNKMTLIFNMVAWSRKI